MNNTIRVCVRASHVVCVYVCVSHVCVCAWICAYTRVLRIRVISYVYVRSCVCVCVFVYVCVCVVCEVKPKKNSNDIRS